MTEAGEYWLVLAVMTGGRLILGGDWTGGRFGGTRWEEGRVGGRYVVPFVNMWEEERVGVERLEGRKRRKGEKIRVEGDEGRDPPPMRPSSMRSS
jgi:hypothetical protein